MASSVSNDDCNNPAASSIIDTSLFLCQCIEDWQRTQTEEARDGRLDWDEIAVHMSSRTGKAVNKNDLQTVWKFIAYGKHFSRSSEQAITYSDDEDPYYQPFTAVKRNKIHSNTCTAAGSSVPTDIKGNLPSSVPEVLNTKYLGKHIKVDIPQHILKGSCGLHPPLYVSSNDLTASSRGPSRIPRVSILSAQGNTAFSAVLKQSEKVFQTMLTQQAMQQHQQTLQQQQLAAAAAKNAVQIVRTVPATAAVKARVSGVQMSGVNGAAGVGLPARQGAASAAAAVSLAAAHQAHLKRLAGAAGISANGSTAPAAKKPNVLVPVGSAGPAGAGQPSSSAKKTVVSAATPTASSVSNAAVQALRAGVAAKQSVQTVANMIIPSTGSVATATSHLGLAIEPLIVSGCPETGMNTTSPAAESTIPRTGI